jgi:hypothetical protein
MQSTRDARIKERAYHIWDAEGRDDSRHEEHWRRAERELVEEERAAANATSGNATSGRAGIAEASGGDDTPHARRTAAKKMPEAGEPAATNPRRTTKPAAPEMSPAEPAKRSRSRATTEPAA